MVEVFPFDRVAHMAVDQLREEPTIGRLVKDAQTEFSTIMRKEIQLAKSELKVAPRPAGSAPC